MSVEEAILELARAVRSQGEASAVAEIIRQRDGALKELASLTQRLRWAESSRDDYQGSYWKQQRKNSALRGVITRMKSKPLAGGEEGKR